MTLSANIRALAQRIAAEFNSTNSRIDGLEGGSSGGPITVDDITDSGAAGRNVVRAATQLTARSAIGLTVGTVNDLRGGGNIHRSYPASVLNEYVHEVASEAVDGGQPVGVTSLSLDIQEALGDLAYDSGAVNLTSGVAQLAESNTGHATAHRAGRIVVFSLFELVNNGSGWRYLLTLPEQFWPSATVETLANNGSYIAAYDSGEVWIGGTAQSYGTGALLSWITDKSRPA